MDRSSSWTNAGRSADYIPPSRVARMAVPSPRPPPGSTAEAVATARRAEYGAGGSILPVLPSASPNASKRTSWTTPRSPTESFEDDFHHSSDETFAPPPRRAEMASMAAARRAEPVRQQPLSDGLFASETEQAQLAYMEQMYGTINLLNAELENERRNRTALEHAAPARPSTYPAMSDYSSYEEDVQLPVGEFDEPPSGFVVSQTPVAPSYSPRKLRTMPSPPSHPPQSQHRTARPPVSPRSIAKDPDEDLCTTLGKNAELRIRSRDMERTVEKTELELELARKQIKMAERRAENREEKLRALLKEKLNWQKELKATRAQVVEEKMRQVDLFREVEAAKRHFAAELESVEQELRSAQEENSQLRTHAAEMKAQINFQARKMEEMARQAQDEKARFVAMIEDTRHRFREWKEGEAEALAAAHEQMMRNLKTEYELKMERHQDEKQKLRDKVNDLEVSMRLLQKDRALSPLELSLRKAAILGSKDNTGTIEAEQIETQSRILELENLLAHSHEYQSRQESIIKLSEATISRLMQEREVTALENLSLHPFGVEPQRPRSEDLPYDIQLTGYVTAPSSPVRRASPPTTPPRSPQHPMKVSEPPIVRSPKSRAHTPRRADLEASIAQAAEADSATNQLSGAEDAVPSTREQSLMNELAQLRKELAEAKARTVMPLVSSDSDGIEEIKSAEQEPTSMPEVPDAPISPGSCDKLASDTNTDDIQVSATPETPIVQDETMEEEVETNSQNEVIAELKAEDTPESDERHAEDTPSDATAIATDVNDKVPCDSALSPETSPHENADEERHSDNVVHGNVVSADNSEATNWPADEIANDSDETSLIPTSVEAFGGGAQTENDAIATSTQETHDPNEQEEPFTHEVASEEISTNESLNAPTSEEGQDKTDTHEDDEMQTACKDITTDDSADLDTQIIAESILSEFTPITFENIRDTPAEENIVTQLRSNKIAAVTDDTQHDDVVHDLDEKEDAPVIGENGVVEAAESLVENRAEELRNDFSAKAEDPGDHFDPDVEQENQCLTSSSESSMKLADTNCVLKSDVGDAENALSVEEQLNTESEIEVNSPGASAVHSDVEESMYELVARVVKIVCADIERSCDAAEPSETQVLKELNVSLMLESLDVNSRLRDETSDCSTIVDSTPKIINVEEQHADNDPVIVDESQDSYNYAGDDTLFKAPVVDNVDIKSNDTTFAVRDVNLKQNQPNENKALSSAEHDGAEALADNVYLSADIEIVEVVETSVQGNTVTLTENSTETSSPAEGSPSDVENEVSSIADVDAQNTSIECFERLSAEVSSINSGGEASGEFKEKVCATTEVISKDDELRLQQSEFAEPQKLLETSKEKEELTYRPTGTPETCMAEALVSLVEHTAISLVASRQETSENICNAESDSISIAEISSPVAQGSNKLEPAEEVHDSTEVIVSDCDIPASMEHEVVKSPTDTDDATYFEVSIEADESLGVSDHFTKHSATLDVDLTPPLESDALSSEDSDSVTLATKAFAESFVLEIMQVLDSSPLNDAYRIVDTEFQQDLTTELIGDDTSVDRVNVLAEDLAGEMIDETLSSYNTNDHDANISTAPTSPTVNSNLEIEGFDSIALIVSADECKNSEQFDDVHLHEVEDSVGSSASLDDTLPGKRDPNTPGQEEKINQSVEQIGGTESQALETLVAADPMPDSASEPLPTVDTLTMAREFVSDIEAIALTAVLSMQSEVYSENLIRDADKASEELESNLTRSFIDSCNFSDEQNDFASTTTDPDEPARNEELNSGNTERSHAEEDVSPSALNDSAGETDTRDDNVSSHFHNLAEEATLQVQVAHASSSDQMEDDADSVELHETTLGLLSDNNEFSTREILSEVAYLFASQAIGEVLNRLLQPYGLSMDQYTIRESTDTIEVNQCEIASEEIHSAGDVNAQTLTSALCTGCHRNEPSTAREKEYLLTETLNEDISVVSDNVREAIKSMIVLVTKDLLREVAEREEVDERRGCLATESDLCIEPDANSGGDQNNIPPEDANYSVEPVVTLDEAPTAFVDNKACVHTTAEPEHEIMGLVLTKMVDKIVFAADKHGSWSEASHNSTDVGFTSRCGAMPDENLSSDAGSDFQPDDKNVQCIDGSLTFGQVSSRLAVEEQITAVDGQMEVRHEPTLVVESSNHFQCEDELTSNVMQAEDDFILFDAISTEAEIAPGVEKVTLAATSGVDSRSDDLFEHDCCQAPEALKYEEISIFDSMLTDIVTAIETCNMNETCLSDDSTTPHENEKTEQLRLMPKCNAEQDKICDESSEVREDLAQIDALASDPDYKDVNNQGAKGCIIEVSAETPCNATIDEERVAVRLALNILVDTVVSGTEAVSIVLEPTIPSKERKSIEPFTPGEDVVAVETETVIPSADNFDIAAFSIESEVGKVVADLCTSVERKNTPRHHGRARSVHFAGGTKDPSVDRLNVARRSVLLWQAPRDTACTKEAVESSAKRRASKRRTSRRTLADLLAFPTEMARFTSSDTTLLAYDARHEQGQPFSLLDHSILTINPNGRHIHLDDSDERVGSKVIGKRKTLMQELHSKNLALRQIPRFNYMPMRIKFQWSDFVVATPVRASDSSIGQGHISKSPVEPMRLLQKKGAKLPCGSYVIVSAFIRPLEDGNENLRVQIYDAERVEEFQFDFSEDIMKKYYLESTGMEAQSLEFLGHLEFRRDEDAIIIKLPEKKAGEGSKSDADRIQSERTMVVGADPRKREPPSKQSRMSAYRQKRPASSPAMTSSQDSSESSSSREPSSAEPSEAEGASPPNESLNVEESESTKTGP
ncbi:unnamed protein product [Phytophthora lilii]|uniref:Unnamed protein product n=1 Tax=Phytophthora lilii TaxID=2077276 RepID=A0A9W6WPA5_9STRA|nr:unnamed protein product [Phytophthora lilii]